MRERKHFVLVMLLLPIVLAPIGGCVSSRLTFGKASLEETAIERDKNECLRSAIGTSHPGFEILVPYCIDRDVFIQCMEARGYAVRPD